MASESIVFNRTKTTQQQLLDYNSEPLAPYTVLDSIRDYKEGINENADLAGMELIAGKLAETLEENEITSTGRASLVVYDSSANSYLNRFKALNLGTISGTTNSELSVFTNAGDFRTIAFDSSTCITGSYLSSADGVLKYKIDLNYNTNQFDSSSNKLSLKTETYVQTGSNFGDLAVLCVDGTGKVLKEIKTPNDGNTVGYARALVCDTDNNLKWGAAGAVLKTIPGDGVYRLIAASPDVTPDKAPSTLYYNTGVYIKEGKLFHTSDESLKHFVHDLDVDLDNIALIKKGIFYWKDDREKVYNIGITAQSIEPFYPELVAESDGIKSVEYSKLGVVALAAIDKLTKRVKELEKEVEELKSNKD